MPYLSKRYLNELFARKKQLFESIAVRDSFENKKNGDKYDIFLSYSYLDKEFAIKIYKLLVECKFSVYIDLKDGTLNRNNVNRKTAERIARIMDECRCLIYVHSASATISKWCPWELGYMSARTSFRCGVIPLTEDNEAFPRQEYLELYPIVNYEKIKGKNEYTFWANSYGTNEYALLKEFVNGKDPYKH